MKHEDLTPILVRAVDEALSAGRRSIEVSGTGDMDLTPLSKIPELERLVISCNYVSDYAPLAVLTNLRELVLISDEQKDLSPLASLTKLEQLRITDGKISSLKPLEALTGLQQLSLAFCQHISSLQPLAKLTKLEWLSLQECEQITSLKPLAKCSRLKRLILVDCDGIEDVAPLAKLTNLQLLVLDNTPVTDLGPLAGLSNLYIGDSYEDDREDLSELVKANALRATATGEPYTRAELEAIAPGEMPLRGIYCAECQQFIPQLAEASEKEFGNSGFASRLHFATHYTACPEHWRTLWASHPNGQHNTAGCPKCGQPLRTKLATQCLSCGARWS